MHTDVTDLRDFYQTPLGLVARRLLAQKIRAKWPRPSGDVIMGFGFATPFLGSFRGEASRICALMPEGQGALVWPSAGLWARTDRTPFGQGRPYSRGQLDALLREAMFTPLEWDCALYLPPIHRALLVRSAPTIERIGAAVSRRFAGVILIEATKELVTPIGSKAPARALRKLVPVQGVLAPHGARRESDSSNENS